MTMELVFLYIAVGALAGVALLFYGMYLMQRRRTDSLGKSNSQHIDECSQRLKENLALTKLLAERTAERDRLKKREEAIESRACAIFEVAKGEHDDELSEHGTLAGKQWFVTEKGV